MFARSDCFKDNKMDKALVEAVKKRPLLYSNHRETLIIDKLWKEVTREVFANSWTSFNESKKSDAEDCVRRRWKLLRARFTKEGQAQAKGPLYDAMSFLLPSKNQENPGEGTSTAAEEPPEPQAEQVDRPPVLCDNCKNRGEIDQEMPHENTDVGFADYLAAHLRGIPYCLKIDLKIEILALLKRAHHMKLPLQCGCGADHMEHTDHTEYHNTPRTFSIASTISDDQNHHNSDTVTAYSPANIEILNDSEQGSSSHHNAAPPQNVEPTKSQLMKSASRKKQDSVQPRVVRLPENHPFPTIPSVDMIQVNEELAEYEIIPVMVTPIPDTVDVEDGITTQAYEIEHVPSGWGFSFGKVSPSSLSTTSNNSALQGSPPQSISPTGSNPPVSDFQDREQPSTFKKSFPEYNNAIQQQRAIQPGTQEQENEQQENQNQEYYQEGNEQHNNEQQYYEQQYREQQYDEQQYQEQQYHEQQYQEQQYQEQQYQEQQYHDQHGNQEEEMEQEAITISQQYQEQQYREQQYQEQPYQDQHENQEEEMDQEAENELNALKVLDEVLGDFE